MNSIGDRPVYPSPRHDVDTGMTYRMWLIGMALSNPEITDTLSHPRDIAFHCRAVSEAVIEHLDTERSDDDG